MKRVLLLLSVVALTMLAIAPAAFAQTSGPSGADGTYNCEDFTDQGQAQEFYNNDPGDTNGLDEDGDGIACESLPTATQGDLPDVMPGAEGVDDTPTSEQYQYEAVASETPPAPASEAPAPETAPLPVSGGMSPLLFVGAAVAMVGLVGFGLLRRRD